MALTSTQRTLMKKVSQLVELYVEISGKTYHTRMWPKDSTIEVLTRDVARWYSERLTTAQVDQVIERVAAKYAF